MSAARSKATKKRLVVDANILRGASRTDGGPPAGVLCRSVLQSILRVCHRAVVSSDLQREYDLHASGFGTRWLSAMRAKSKVVPTPARETKRARRWLQDAEELSSAKRRELAKDMHLILAALETDSLVVSAERSVRAILEAVLQETDPPLGWAVISSSIDSWLETGTPIDDVKIV